MSEECGPTPLAAVLRRGSGTPGRRVSRCGLALAGAPLTAAPVPAAAQSGSNVLLAINNASAAY